MPVLKKVALFTNEYPPHVYGGAGVHVEYLARAMAKLLSVEVRCFGDERSEGGNPAVRGYPPWAEAKRDTDSRFASAEGRSGGFRFSSAARAGGCTRPARSRFAPATRFGSSSGRSGSNACVS